MAKPVYNARYFINQNAAQLTTTDQIIAEGNNLLSGTNLSVNEGAPCRRFFDRLYIHQQSNNALLALAKQHEASIPGFFVKIDCYSAAKGLETCYIRVAYPLLSKVFQAKMNEIENSLNLLSEKVKRYYQNHKKRYDYDLAIDQLNICKNQVSLFTRIPECCKIRFTEEQTARLNELGTKFHPIEVGLQTNPPAPNFLEPLLEAEYETSDEEEGRNCSSSSSSSLDSSWTELQTPCTTILEIPPSNESAPNTAGSGNPLEIAHGRSRKDSEHV